MGAHAGSRPRLRSPDRSRETRAITHLSPPISVIVPAWNAEATLAETLQSVAGQTYRNIEIIIVDDGSTDRTPDIAREFCASEPRARLITKENGGVASARNRGIAEAAGAWMAPIDADDLWHPTRIEKMLAAALAAPDPPGFVYCWNRHIDANGCITASGPNWAVEGRAFHEVAYLNVVGNGSGLLAARDALAEVGGYDSSLRAERAQGAEDLLTQIRIARSHPVALVPEYLVGWRQTGSSMSGDVEQMDRSCRLVYRRLAEDGTPVPRRIERRMLASSALDVAERYAFTGKLWQAVKWLARALRLDPLRSGMFVAYRIVRSARRRFGPSAAAQQLRRFLEAEPDSIVHGDFYRIDAFATLLRMMDLRRLERLAELDRMGLSHGERAGELHRRPVSDLYPRQGEGV